MTESDETTFLWAWFCLVFPGVNSGVCGPQSVARKLANRVGLHCILLCRGTHDGSIYRTVFLWAGLLLGGLPAAWQRRTRRTICRDVVGLSWLGGFCSVLGVRAWRPLFMGGGVWSISRRRYY